LPRLHITSSTILFFLFMLRPPPISTLFPYTTLFRSVIFNRTGGFHDVDSAGTFADSQLRSPRGCIQSAGQIDVGCLRPLSVVRVIAGFDQIPWLQVRTSAMVKRRLRDLAYDPQRLAGTA